MPREPEAQDSPVVRSDKLTRLMLTVVFFFFQAEDGIRDKLVTGVQTCALPISESRDRARRVSLLPAAAGPHRSRRNSQASLAACARSFRAPDGGASGESVRGFLRAAPQEPAALGTRRAACTAGNRAARAGPKARCPRGPAGDPLQGALRLPRPAQRIPGRPTPDCPSRRAGGEYTSPSRPRPQAPRRSGRSRRWTARPWPAPLERGYQRLHTARKSVV